MLRSVGRWLACLRTPRACAVRLVQRRSASYRYFHMQKKAAIRETRRLDRGTGNPFRDQFGGGGERRP